MQRQGRGAAAAMLAAAIAMACGGGGSDGTTAPPTPQGTISIAATSPTLIVSRGGSASLVVAVSRGNGYAGTVALAVSGAPSGVVATMTPSQLDATQPSATLTVSAGASAVAGSATLTIQASGSGVSTQSTTVALTVTAPTFALSVTPASLSVAAGQSGAATVGIVRSSGFTAPVTLTLEGAPAGVSATISPATPTGATAALGLNVAPTVAAGSYALTVRGTATGAASATASLALTVTPAAQAGPFSLALSATSYLALPSPGIGSQPVLTITRNSGFTGPVALSVTGLPIGLVVGVTPTNATSNTATVVVLDGGAANGSYPVTIRGTGGGGSESVTLTVVVAPPTTGAITWKMCATGIRTPTYFFALRDGSGPWTRIVPGPDDKTFSFDVTQPRASVALVTVDSGVARTTVYDYTADEMRAAAASECALYPGVTQRTANGQMTGVPQGSLALVAMGWWFDSNLGGGYSLQNLPAGPLDLVAIRAMTTAQGTSISDRAIVRRGVNPASGASNAPIDFASAESFPLTASTWTFGNTNGESFSVSQTITTAGGTTGLFHAIPQPDRAETVRSVYSIPAAQTVAGDLHQVVATIGTNFPVHPTRQVIVYGRTLADRSIDFGPPLPAPMVSVAAGGSAGRLRAQGTLPPEYVSGIAFDVKSTGPNARFATVLATRGFLGAGSAYDVEMPDLSNVLGWDTNWSIRPGDATNWWLSGGGPVMDYGDARFVFNTTRRMWTGAQTGITAPVDGAVYRMARASGTITP